MLIFGDPGVGDDLSHQACLPFELGQEAEGAAELAVEAHFIPKHMFG